MLDIVVHDTLKKATRGWASRKREQNAGNVSRRSGEKIREVVNDALPSAFAAASDGGRLPATVRQIYYALRPVVQERSGKTLDYNYFAQTLMPEYLEEWCEGVLGEMCGGIDAEMVVNDVRGHLEEPHTARRIELGTLEARRYLGDCDDAGSPDPAVSVAIGGVTLYPTCGASNRFSAILFIEKEGFFPLLRGSGILKEYDLALATTKGMPVMAMHEIVNAMCLRELGVKLLVMHDFDKSGLSIVGSFVREASLRPHVMIPDIADLGLRLRDVEAYNLESESVSYGYDPTLNLMDNGATEAEVKFLRGDCTGKGYLGSRVELNAFGSADMLRWLRGRLDEIGMKKVVPDAATLDNAYRRAVEEQEIAAKLRRITTAARRAAAKTPVPADLGERVAAMLKDTPTLSWDAAMRRIVAQEGGRA